MDTIKLSRECRAITIPSGREIVLGEGTEVYITQSLGGTYTIQAPGGLFRIQSEDADALGISQEVGTNESKESRSSSEPADEKAIWDALKTVYDPEIPVNIVDLGLVYDLVIEEVDGRRIVHMKMTLTAPGCGMGPVIAQDAQNKILSLEGIHDASVEVVWDPAWHKSMITADGRKILGL
ncbi:MAG: putative Fe-S cluster assembly protein SufT [Verrucomicrobia bacterium]|nr:putative Fe-S cluster assembly protein SufT [Verrucomicrobiota bacterium]